MNTEVACKTCTTCGETKELSMFGKDRNRKDGMKGICKQCHNDYYNKNKDRIISQQLSIYHANKDKIADRIKKYRADNREHYAQLVKAQKEKHREQIAESGRQYYLKNKESILDKHHAYRVENKQLIYEIGKRYSKTDMGRAVQINAKQKRRVVEGVGTVTSKDMARLRSEATECFWCESPLDKTRIHIDHVVPLSNGGKHELSNLVASCPTCNLRKGKKMPQEFAKIVGKTLPEFGVFSDWEYVLIPAVQSDGI